MVKQVKEECKGRFELIFVEGVNVTVQSTLVNPSSCCRGASQVADSQRVRRASGTALNPKETVKTWRLSNLIFTLHLSGFFLTV